METRPGLRDSQHEQGPGLDHQRRREGNNDPDEERERVISVPCSYGSGKAGFTPRRSGSVTAQDKKNEHHPLSTDEACSDSPDAEVLR